MTIEKVIRMDYLNTTIKQTQITDSIQVSTVITFYDSWWGNYYQYETWCFSKDPRQKSFQKIHGTTTTGNDKGLIIECIQAHDHIAENLKRMR